MAEVMRYAEMKDSGVEWLGEIPEDWKIYQLSQFASQVRNKNSNLQENNLLSLSYGKIKRKDIHNVEGLLPASFEGYNIIETGDIVLRLTDLQNDHTSLRVGLSKEKGIITSAYVTIRPKESVSPEFLYYFLHAFDIRKGLYGMGSGVRQGLTYDEIKTLKIVLPDRTKQEMVACYLDDQCAQIDNIIANAKASIEEYKAWKASVIFEAVTKGLDASVEMKDSGVESLGEIPADWNLVRLKFLLEAIVDCPHETPNYNEDGPYFVIRTADQDVGFLRSDDKMYRLNEQEYLSRIRRMSLEKGDIVYGREGERWGLACLIPESNKYCLGQRMMHFRCDSSKILPEFALWALNSQGTYTQGIMDTLGSTSPHVNISTIKNFALAVPSLEKQREIVFFLTDKNEQIQQVIEEKEALIANLESYKKSLIYEVVTGKRKVV